ncbi:hypothetical protein GQS_00170 [Thermococcus sp. 4557]|nr:hypothetical protein [Thermococcus sp. 4557]AEK71937.1 hypothetical protein GQS_00170 [Thermococcus sp. 4557]
MRRIPLLLLLAMILPLVTAENPGLWWVKAYGGRDVDMAYAVAIARN